MKPIIDWIFIDKMHEREIKSKNDNNKYISNQLGNIISFKIKRKLKQEESDNENIDKMIDELNDIKED